MSRKHTNTAAELESICTFFRQALKDYDYNHGKVGEMDRLTQDYLHDLELGRLCYEERAKLATKLRNCRRERRIHKDRVQLLTPLVELLRSDRGKSFFNLLNGVLGETRKIESTMETRTYRHKVRQEKKDD